MKLRFIHFFIIFFTYIVCIFFLTLFSLINSYRLVAESSAHDLLFMLISLKLYNNTVNFNYIGYCLQVSILEGLLYSLEYNDSFYLVFYPDVNHAAVIINNTLYTTSYILSNFRLIYECKIDDYIRDAILSNNKSKILDAVFSYFEKNLLFVKCSLSFKRYNDISLILLSKVYL